MRHCSGRLKYFPISWKLPTPKPLNLNWGPFSTLWVKIARMCRFGSASTFLLLSWSIYGLTLPFLELLPKMPWRSGDWDAKLMAVGDVNDNHCWYHGLCWSNWNRFHWGSPNNQWGQMKGYIGHSNSETPLARSTSMSFHFAPTPHLFLWRWI